MQNKPVDSALHVLKGAAQKVLNTPITTSVYSEGPKGRLTLECSKAPTEQELKEIENLANKKIEEDAEIKTFDIDRKDAELKYAKRIYDKFEVPAHITNLKICMIENWNINCCNGVHYERTGEIGHIKILKHRFRAGRNELEISFEVHNNA